MLELLQQLSSSSLKGGGIPPFVSVVDFALALETDTQSNSAVLFYPEKFWPIPWAPLLPLIFVSQQSFFFRRLSSLFRAELLRLTMDRR